jgi:hypothetical protein
LRALSPQLPLFIQRETLMLGRRFLLEPTPWEEHMSLRDFNMPSSDKPGGLHNDPLGNGSGLGSFHTTNPEDREPNRTPQMIGAAAVVLMVGVAAAGLYAYSGPSKPAPMVTASNLASPPSAASAAPAPSAPVAQPETTTPDANMAASTATPTAPADSDSAIANHKAAKSRSAPRHIARSEDSSNSTGEGRLADQSSSTNSAGAQPETAATQTAGNQPVTPPLPAAPQPSTSDVATNNSTAQAAPSNATTASDMPMNTTANNATPSQSASSTTENTTNTASAQGEQNSAAPVQAQPNQAAQAAQAGQASQNQ